MYYNEMISNGKNTLVNLHILKLFSLVSRLFYVTTIKLSLFLVVILQDCNDHFLCWYISSSSLEWFTQSQVAQTHMPLSPLIIVDFS